MQPLYDAPQIKKWDDFTIKNEPIDSIDLMERAAQKFAHTFTALFDSEHPVYVFCGSGNNGGDGLAIARLLFEKKYHVKSFYVESLKYSSDFSTNLKRLKALTKPTLVKPDDELSPIPKNAIIIDALLGSGLHNEPKGIYADLIYHINQQSPEKVISVDVPSGLPCEGIPDWHTVIKADLTWSFQIPKRSFFLAENEKYTGRFEVLDIGLSSDFQTKESTNHFLVNDSVKAFIKHRSKFGHKGTYGHVLLAGGSFGKIGAITLAVKAALRSGCGLVTAHIPNCGYISLQSAEPACMVTVSGNTHHTYFPDSESFNAVGIGPGMGTNTETKSIFIDFIRQATAPLVIDADGLNILAEENALELVKPHTILTPHPKEFDRMFGKSEDSIERLEKLINACKKHRLFIVLKGAYTCTCTPDGILHFNSTGNPGMGTGGSGDILTGILTSLLAQGYTQKEACLLGVYLHGLAGDIAAEKLTEQGMYAPDIIDNLPSAWR